MEEKRESNWAKMRRTEYERGRRDGYAEAIRYTKAQAESEEHRRALFETLGHYLSQLTNQKRPLR